ncbi:MAG: hypothetical protein M3Y27_11610 [Acidobacteriota bacterium]|nr:hypothetical protein [Acidobacteriota bacterium]
MARKLACLFYRLLKQGQQYVDKGAEYYEQRHRSSKSDSSPNVPNSLGYR